MIYIFDYQKVSNLITGREITVMQGQKGSVEITINKVSSLEEGYTIHANFALPKGKVFSLEGLTVVDESIAFFLPNEVTEYDGIVNFELVASATEGGEVNIISTIQCSINVVRTIEASRQRAI